MSPQTLASMNTVLPLMLLLMVFSGTNSSSCPHQCQAGPCSLGKLICDSPISLRQLPQQGLPKKLHQISVSRQHFSQPRLAYRNLSTYGPERMELLSLHVTRTNLQSIEPEAFSHLISLRSLDLSNNELGVIASHTFKGLSLTSLRLDDNTHLSLLPSSLRGLVVAELSICGCRLTSLNYEVIHEVSGHLSRLHLGRNSISVIDQRFRLVFGRLEVVGLEDNPFLCNCDMGWLLKLLRERHRKQSLAYLQQPQPHCQEPPELRGRSLIGLADPLLVCRPPSVARLDVRLHANNSGHLLCEADNRAESLVEWRHKVFSTSAASSASDSSSITDQYYRFYDHSKAVGSSSIAVLGSAPVDHYTCHVANSQGEVSVEVHIVWPSVADSTNSRSGFNKNMPTHSNTSSSDKKEQVRYHYPESQGGLDGLNWWDSESRLRQSLLHKSYSLFELLLAIMGTMATTGLLSCLSFIGLCRKRRQQRHKQLQMHQNQQHNAHMLHRCGAPLPLPHSDSRDTAEAMSDSVLTAELILQPPPPPPPLHPPIPSSISQQQQQHYSSCQELKISLPFCNSNSNHISSNYSCNQLQHLIDFKTQQVILPLTPSYSNWSLKI